MNQVVVLFDPPPPHGGVRVLSAVTFSLLKKQFDLVYTALPFDTNERNLAAAIKNFLCTSRKANAVLFQIGDIFSLLRKRGLLYFFVSMLAAKSTMFRGFGGGLAIEFKRLSRLKQWVLLNMLAAFSCITFETKEDFAFFSTLLRIRSVRVHWLPNSRAIQPYSIPFRKRARRFCFVGRVCRSKGVHLLVQAAPLLPAGVTIDIYGPADPTGKDDTGIHTLTNDLCVRYHGTIEPERVIDIIKNYDGLILPTRWRTEGHPGVILEAFSVGIPVISTRWNGIPELVNNSCGILIDPNSVDSLVEAITTMHNDQVRWQAMRSAALERVKQFDSEVWTRRLHEWILEVVS